MADLTSFLQLGTRLRRADDVVARLAGEEPALGGTASSATVTRTSTEGSLRQVEA
jgi:hypothetical protein